MDVLAHVLWAGVAAHGLRRLRPMPPRDIAATLLLAVAPDVGQFLPVLAWSIGQPDPVTAAREFLFATPGHEPAMPGVVVTLSHHLHCIGHSVVVAALVALAVWHWRGGRWLPLVGWWTHIVLDIPTHSKDYYAVPFLYPFSDWSLDGIAWTQPWFLAANYACIALVYAVWVIPGMRLPRRC